MRRWAFNIAAGVLLLLCLVTAIDWVVTYTYAQEPIVLQYGNSGNRYIQRRIAVLDLRGRLQLQYDRCYGPPRPGFQSQFEYHYTARSVDDSVVQGVIIDPAQRVAAPTWFNRLGFDYKSGAYQFAYFDDCWSVDATVPHWFVTLLFSLTPALWLLTYRRRRIARYLRLGLCPTCHYDLRATSDRCPECGTQVPPGHLPTVTDGESQQPQR